MLKVYAGWFHPELEEKLIEVVKGLKEGDPAHPIALVAPSKNLVRRLKQIMADSLEQGAFAIYFFNIYQLAREIAAESGKLKNRQIIKNKWFQEEILRQIITAKTPPLFASINFQYTAGELLASIMDLKESGLGLHALKELDISTVDVAEIVRERNLSDEFYDEDLLKVSEDELEKLKGLIELLEAYEDHLRRIRGYDLADIYKIAAENVQSSQLVSQFKTIIFYGFYELAELQLELFKDIIKNFDNVVLFYPYTDSEFLEYTKAFFEMNILPLTKDIVWLKHEAVNPLVKLLEGYRPDKEEEVEPCRRFVKFSSSAGPYDEVWNAAKEITSLISKGLANYSDIAIVARNIQNYQDPLKDVLTENLIPFKTNAQVSITGLSIAKFLNALIECYHTNMDTKSVKRLFSFGYQQTKSLNEYSRVLNRELSKFNRCKSWPDFSRCFLEIIDQLIDTSQVTKLDLQVLDLIRDNLTDIKILDDIMNGADFDKFAELVPQILEKISFSLSDDNRLDSVACIDVMQLRGLKFKYVFILGLNAKIFPRFILEDPFLNDTVRLRLVYRLGLNIPIKRAAYKEESLLFYTAISSATDGLHLSYLRADQDGKKLVPSRFIVDIAEQVSKPQEVTGISWAIEGLSEKVQKSQISRISWLHQNNRSSLTQPEALMLLGSTRSLQRQELMDSLVPLGLQINLFTRSLDLISGINSSSNVTQYEGYLESASDVPGVIFQRGLSPSAFETLIQCPMKFFLGNVLRLKIPQEETEFLKRLEAGTLYHKILEEFYKKFVNQPIDKEKIATVLKGIIDNINLSESTRMRSYPILEQAIKTRFLEILSRFISYELDQDIQQGYQPQFFERWSWIDLNPVIKVKGRMDKVAINKNKKLARVVDYKISRPSRIDFLSKVIQDFQLVLYRDLTKQFLHETGVEGYEVEWPLIRYVEDIGYPKSTHKGEYQLMDTNNAQSRGKQILSILIELLNSRIFFIKEGWYCRWCDFANICRKNYYPSTRKMWSDSREVTKNFCELDKILSEEE